MDEYILELRNITKRFPGVVALNGVQFQLKQGEIHALMGENGAGKSTLIKVITGVHEPEEGDILINGRKAVFKNTNDSAANSIAAIYQHSTVYPYLSVTENIFIGHESLTKAGSIKWNEMHARAKELLLSLGCGINPRTRMVNLSVAEQQIVEISKAVSSKARIVIMDEPTAALSKRECEELYRITEKLKAEGTSIIFISHRMEDMYRLADRVTVFRDARYIGTWDVDRISKDELISAMVGREVTQLYPKQAVPIGGTALEVKGLTKKGYFKDISFDVKKGEIFGLTGLVGSGRSEVCQRICGLLKPDSGKLYVGGEECIFTHPSQALKKGVGYLPEDRQQQGLILSWELYRNMTLSTLDKYNRLIGIDTGRERQTGKELCEKLQIKAKSIFSRADSLSGGNQQKVVFAKLLNSDVNILLLDEPTKGVDVGAKAQIYSIMSDLAAQGYAIILVSSEMPEVMSMADRIGVMHEGHLAAIFDASHVTQEEILAAAMTAKDEDLKEGA